MQPYSSQGGGYPPQPPPPPAPKQRQWVIPVAVFVVLSVIGVGAVLAFSGDDDPSTSTGGSGDGEERASDGGASAAGAATSLTGSWEGTYECGGTPAGLTLTIDDTGDGTIGANFAYHPTDENPDAGTGRYSLQGALADGQLTLEGDTWNDPEEGDSSHPMVGLAADLADRSSSEHLEGTLVGGESCTTFSVDRTSTDPWYAGVWEGGYGCSQGLTALTLTVEPGPDNTATATFDFSAHPDNPGVPSGSFAMEGEYQDGALSLQGVEWIEQPDDYLMVDLRFHSERGIDPQRMYGEVVGAPPSCSIFELLRPEPPEQPEE
jgi:hypothetical protein